MAQQYLYNTGTLDSCAECLQWDGQTGTADELPITPNPDCYNGSCNCYLEEIEYDGDDCEALGLVNCIDAEDFEFCGEEGEEGCGEDGCWCIEGIGQDGQTEVECDNAYWDPNCVCSDECPDRDDEGD